MDAEHTYDEVDRAGAVMAAWADHWPLDLNPDDWELLVRQVLWAARSSDADRASIYEATVGDIERWKADIRAMNAPGDPPPADGAGGRE